MRTTTAASILLFGIVLGAAPRACAQDAVKPAAPPADAESAAAPETQAAGEASEAKPEGTQPDLAAQQEQVAERYSELERLLLRMAELTASTDPRRAALLRRAVAQSKDRAIGEQFQELVELLRQERLAPVVKNQQAVHDELVKLLELLLSEDRTKRIASEKERIRDYLKRVNQIIREQRAVQGETRRADDPKQLAERQGELSEKTGELAGDVNESEGSKPSDQAKDGKDAEGGKPGEKQDPQDKKLEKDTDGESDKSDKKDESQERDDEPKDEQDGDKSPNDKSSDEKSSDGKDGKPGKDSQPQAGDSKPSDSKPGENQESDSKPGEAPPVPAAESPQGQGQPGEQSQQSPAEQRLKQAQQRMQEAQKKLEEAKKSDATDKQAEALKELEQAKAELEEILRQLREEEMTRTLAMLEARFRKMLDEQVAVFEGTKRLGDVPADQRDRDDELEAGRLSRKEGEIAVEADKALDVLREEGSAVAFPEAVVEIRDDMLTARDLLAKADVGEITQGVEQDVITALEEMIAALQKAQKDAQNKDQPPPSGEPGSGEFEPPLVDALSELKMIRALQMRVNVRTQRYAKLAEADDADRPALLSGLKQLAERERRIHKVTRDIVVGRNR